MFKKSSKKIALIITFTLILSAMIHPLYATGVDESIVQPCWTNVASVRLSLISESSPMQVRVVIAGSSGTSYNSGTLVLTKISGTNCGLVKQWTNISSSGPSLIFSDTIGELTSGTYRLTISIKAKKNGVSETISMYSDTTI